ncbi:hypothetical protein FA15DRAFT_676174 [Coprinopsis marcescibilis]|uniref:Uncharacterized protein n=1 Tax=Coprinopsis marcescibilis TaxID=230819 RepID=A0A5C3KB33_COPMA|nr:hypothetical protein FA15DRAFT_676174 [Coprinopsis marcescibilis]
MTEALTSFEWTSTLQGWLQRAAVYDSAPHKSSGAFTPPDGSQLEFIVLRSSQGQDTGFTLAIFNLNTSPAQHLAIDAAGHLHMLAKADAARFVALAREVTELVDRTGTSWWSVRTPVTCRPIERIIIPRFRGNTSHVIPGPTDADAVQSGAEENVDVSVSAFSFKERRLRPEGEGADGKLLPESVWELIGASLEAEKGLPPPGVDADDKDEVVLKYVKDVLISQVRGY